MLLKMFHKIDHWTLVNFNLKKDCKIDNVRKTLIEQLLEWGQFWLGAMYVLIMYVLIIYAYVTVINKDYII